MANHTDHTHLVHEDDVGKVDTFNLGFPKVTLCLNSMHSKKRIAKYFDKIADKINTNGREITFTMFQVGVRGPVRTISTIIFRR